MSLRPQQRLRTPFTFLLLTAPQSTLLPVTPVVLPWPVKSPAMELTDAGQDCMPPRGVQDWCVSAFQSSYEYRTEADVRHGDTKVTSPFESCSDG